MDTKKHLLFLEQMYLNAPIVRALFPESSIQLKEGGASIECPLRQTLFHAGGSLHGSVYFRMLDDAAYFAASSLEQDFFLLTVEFNLKFLRPLTKGTIKAEGELLEEDRDKGTYLAQARLFTAEGKLAAKGKGRFSRSKKRLREVFPPAE